MNATLVKVIQGATQTTAHIAQVAKIKSPIILLTVGIVGVVTSAVLIGRTSYVKAADIMEEHADKIDLIEERKELGKFHTEKELGKEYLATNLQTAWNFTVAYALPVTVGVISIGLMIKSNSILAARNAKLFAAYVGLQETFNRYRRNIIEEHGTQADARAKLGYKKIEVIDEDGSVSDLIVKTQAGDSLQHSILSLDSSPLWVKGSMRMTVHSYEQARLNLQRRFDRKGHLFMNEVYETIHEPQTAMGAIDGWSKAKGDTVISFGEELHKLVHSDDACMAFTDDCILLDFNCSGEILSTFDIKKKTEYKKVPIYAPNEKGNGYPAYNETN